MTTTTLKTIDSALFLSAPNEWGDVILAMKPGAHLLLISPIKEHHTHTIRAEDSGLEVRDTIAYVFANGENGDTTMQLIAMARKPLDGTVAENVLRWGVGGLSIDKCRIDVNGEDLARDNKPGDNGWKNSSGGRNQAAIRRDEGLSPQGRWPANLILQDCSAVSKMFPSTHGAGNIKNSYDDPDREYSTNSVYQGKFNHLIHNPNYHGNSGGSTARFFYSAPTLNNLIEYLLKLITPPGGTILTSPQDFDLVEEAAKVEGFTVVKL